MYDESENAVPAMKAFTGAPRESQVPAEIDRQLPALERLHHLVDVVYERTAPVRLSRQMVATDRIDRDEPQPALAGVAQAIASTTGSIDAASARLEQLIRELEI